MGILKSGEFADTGESDPVGVIGKFVVVIKGEGTFEIQRRNVTEDPDAGFVTISKDADGNKAAFTLDGGSAADLVLRIEEDVANVQYRIACTDHDNGGDPAIWRIEQ